MRGRPLLGALVFAGLAVVVLVAAILGPAPGHRPGPLEWTLQLVVIAVAVLLVAVRVRRRH